jgi:two-component system C4-dicarboxylate transport response regulator DctD
MDSDFDGLSILVVQPDDPTESDLLQEVMQRRRALISWERDLRHARMALAATSFDVVVAHDQLPDGTGLALIADRANRLQRWSTILLTECCDRQSVASALRMGAVDVIDRAGGPKRLMEALDSLRVRRSVPTIPAPAIDAPKGRPAPPASPPGRMSSGTAAASILGQAPAILRLRDSVERVARLPADVLLIGETGSGKDLVLQQIHAMSGRTGPLVALNCGAIPDTLFESELFGHDAGAFTGANKARRGKFEEAEGGTLFLDEIDSMPLNQQVKLLRVLETRRVGRVGGQGERTLDLRIVAACPDRLEERCRQGLFRLDLWHRLNVVTLEVPALRNRRGDIGLLFEHYAAEACERYSIDPASLRKPDIARLTAYSWPGNVRELKHAAERFVLGLKVLPDDGLAEESTSLDAQLAHCERALIKSALERHGRSLQATAQALGISEKTLSRRVATYGLDVGKGRWS